jgi:hypothetical protein
MHHWQHKLRAMPVLASRAPPSARYRWLAHQHQWQAPVFFWRFSFDMLDLADFIRFVPAI